MAAAVLFLVAYALAIIGPGVVSPLAAVRRVVTWATSMLFAIDYVVRLLLAGNRYIVRHWRDLLIIALPPLRPLRMLRPAALLAVLNRKATRGLRGRIALYVTGGAALLAFCGSQSSIPSDPTPMPRSAASATRSGGPSRP